MNKTLAKIVSFISEKECMEKIL